MQVCMSEAVYDTIVILVFVYRVQGFFGLRPSNSKESIADSHIKSYVE